MFALVLGSLLLPAYLIIQKKTQKLSHQLAFLWFLASGSIHFFFEGYFTVFHKTLAGHSTLFGELWKEYALSDSRYLSSDPFVLFMEAITAFAWGPICYLIAYMVYHQDSRRHLFIVVVSVGQIYGDVLYYMTTLFEGAPHTRPEPFYFWAYFVFMNAIWLVIPTCFIIQSGTIALDILDKVKEVDGGSKKTKKQ
ncbi:Emopamil-binding protein [Neoconidiobolus thromboides FSU 785]|nr:Emopamil-binding protein [Neoconidiobolus thromboides FSU 785]